MASARGGRPRIRDREDPRQHIGFPVPVWLKRQIEIAAQANGGRSLSQEGVERLASTFRPVVGLPPELEAFLELVGRAMLDVGETVSKANRWSGHGEKGWIDDAYAWNQGVDAAQHILELSRHEGGEPHGLFASSDYPENLAKELGKQAADGILEVMRGRHEPEPGRTIPATQWARPIRERLGSVAARLDRHPSPDEYNVVTRQSLGPPVEEAGERPAEAQERETSQE
jgi:hypothetical protein